MLLRWLLQFGHKFIIVILLDCALLVLCRVLFQKVTKGARHKIVISIQKLQERQQMLRDFEKVSLFSLLIFFKRYFLFCFSFFSYQSSHALGWKFPFIFCVSSSPCRNVQYFLCLGLCFIDGSVLCSTSSPFSLTFPGSQFCHKSQWWMTFNGRW